MKRTIKTYREAREYLEGFIPFVINHRLREKDDSLGRMTHFLNLLDNPQNKFPSVVVSGTSGKGSVSYLISHALTKSGYKTGLTISPHLEYITERMQINNRLLTDKEFVKSLNKIIPVIDLVSKSTYGPPSYYEILLAMAFVLFSEKKADIAIVEVGLEGRYDATNLVNPLIFVLNNISLDHTQILGDTVYKIAQEASFRIKNLRMAGNTKPVVITGVNQPLLIRLIEKRSREAGAPVVRLGKDFSPRLIKETGEGVWFDFYWRGRKKRFFVSLRGGYQAENASLALASLKTLKKFGFNISQESLKTAFARSFFPGRFELIEKENYRIILDGAHNPIKMASFMASLAKIYSGEKKIFIVGFKKDKDINALLKPILNKADGLIVTRFKSTIDWGFNMAMDIAVIKETLLNYKVPWIIFEENPELALQKAVEKQKNLGGESLIIVTGSLYLVGEIRNLLFKK
ncbi:Mur ligase family protein [Patescibacteria group bacterium]|nr:Mur ligase family protein [Patescibacteria group bacterium]